MIRLLVPRRHQSRCSEIFGLTSATTEKLDKRYCKSELMRPVVDGLQYAEEPGGSDTWQRQHWEQKRTKDCKSQNHQIPGASNVADLGTKHLDWSSIQKRIGEAPLIHSWKSVRNCVPCSNATTSWCFSIWNTSMQELWLLTSISEQHHEWRRGTLRKRKKSKNSDRGWTKTAEGPNGAILPCESPCSTTYPRKRKIEPHTQLNVPLNDTWWPP